MRRLMTSMQYCVSAFVALVLLACAGVPAQGAVFVGATLDKNIDALPDDSITLAPESMVQLADLTFTGTPGETLYQTEFLDLAATVIGGDFVIDGSHVVSRGFDINGAVDSFDVIVSFADTESVVNGGGSVSIDDEDLVRITLDGGVVSSSLFFDFDEGDLVNNIDLNAFHLLSDTELLVSFDKDVTNFLGSGLDITKDDVTKFTISGTSTITATSTFIDLDFGSSANLDAFAITSDGSVLGSFAQTISDPQDGTVQDHDIWRFSTAGSSPASMISVTDISVALFLDNTGIDTNVNLESLFAPDVPEPAHTALLGIGLSLLIYARRRRVAAAPAG